MAKVGGLGLSVGNHLVLLDIYHINQENSCNYSVMTKAPQIFSYVVVVIYRIEMG